jgi:hypothetical protein
MAHHRAAGEPAPALAPPDYTRAIGRTCCTGLPAPNRRRAFGPRTGLPVGYRAALGCRLANGSRNGLYAGAVALLEVVDEVSNNGAGLASRTCDDTSAQYGRLGVPLDIEGSTRGVGCMEHPAGRATRLRLFRYLEAEVADTPRAASVPSLGAGPGDPNRWRRTPGTRSQSTIRVAKRIGGARAPGAARDVDGRRPQSDAAPRRTRPTARRSADSARRPAPGPRDARGSAPAEVRRARGRSNPV